MCPPPPTSEHRVACSSAPCCVDCTLGKEGSWAIPSRGMPLPLPQGLGEWCRIRDGGHPAGRQYRGRVFRACPGGTRGQGAVETQGPVSAVLDALWAMAMKTCCATRRNNLLSALEQLTPTGKISCVHCTAEHLSWHSAPPGTTARSPL